MVAQTFPRKVLPFTQTGVLIAVAALSIACGGAAAERPEAAQSPTAAPAPEPAVKATASPVPSVTPTTVPATTAQSLEYDPKANMFRLFSGPNHQFENTMLAMRLAQENEDVSQVPVIIEMLRFFGAGAFQGIAEETLRELTGQQLGGGPGSWDNWHEWLGEHSSEYPPPEGYVEWKINLLSLIDPRFAEFLGSADETARIDLTEVVWGGVAPDGIPDLQNAPAILAQEADYLSGDDRVFGVSINGENRAYPLRIVNAHEMANDVLGGEPIALAY